LFFFIVLLLATLLTWQAVGRGSAGEVGGTRPASLRMDVEVIEGAGDLTLQQVRIDP
jgi:hypothetical protein